jgi:peptidoglycan/xylan/chitin deacetylase (PgdA/CDA1 family)
MYHRVTELPNDPHILAVTPAHFAEQMEVVRKHYIPIQLQELVEALRDGDVPDRGVVVTFDDGYADNLYEARSWLERYEIPATVFVTAGYVGSRREFWWDELDRLLLQPGTLPENIRLKFNGNSCEWDLGESSIYTRENFQLDRNWHLERKDDPTPRHALFRMLFKRLSTLSGGEKHKILDDLLSWSGAAPNARSSHKSLTEAEINGLKQSGLIDIGAHTMTHPVLCSLPVAEQRKEIRGSKEFLEAIINRPVMSFAYPHGAYSRETHAVVRENGFSAACSSHTDPVCRGANLFSLPRILVRDWDGETFARSLRSWFGK